MLNHSFPPRDTLCLLLAYSSSSYLPIVLKVLTVQHRICRHRSCATVVPPGYHDLEPMYHTQGCHDLEHLRYPVHSDQSWFLLLRNRSTLLCASNARQIVISRDASQACAFLLTTCHDGIRDVSVVRLRSSSMQNAAGKDRYLVCRLLLPSCKPSEVPLD